MFYKVSGAGGLEFKDRFGPRDLGKNDLNCPYFGEIPVSEEMLTALKDWIRKSEATITKDEDALKALIESLQVDTYPTYVFYKVSGAGGLELKDRFEPRDLGKTDLNCPYFGEIPVSGEVLLTSLKDWIRKTEATIAKDENALKVLIESLPVDTYPTYMFYKVSGAGGLEFKDRFEPRDLGKTDLNCPYFGEIPVSGEVLLTALKDWIRKTEATIAKDENALKALIESLPVDTYPTYMFYKVSGAGLEFKDRFEPRDLVKTDLNCPYFGEISVSGEVLLTALKDWIRKTEAILPGKQRRRRGRRRRRRLPEEVGVVHEGNLVENDSFEDEDADE